MRYNTLPGYDAWKTREPDYGPEPDIQWYVETFNPHRAGRQEVLGPFDSKRDAIDTANIWVREHKSADNSRFADDYGYEDPWSEDANEGCTCARSLRSRQTCEIHGIDPDTAHDARADR